MELSPMLQVAGSRSALQDLDPDATHFLGGTPAFVAAAGGSGSVAWHHDWFSADALRRSGDQVVGRPLWVWRRLDGRWRQGRVTDSVAGLNHRVLFSDGSWEFLTLHLHYIRWDSERPERRPEGQLYRWSGCGIREAEVDADNDDLDRPFPTALSQEEAAAAVAAARAAEQAREEEPEGGEAGEEAGLAIRPLLWPGYHSTDLEVHRNWLAITWNEPPHLWYFEATSQWTLDYPPLFAWFERSLASLASLVAPDGLKLQAEPIETPAVVGFLRVSVLLSDIVLAVGALALARTLPKGRQGWALGLVVLSPGLLVLDHVHFQYNGMLVGVMLASFAWISQGLRTGQLGPCLAGAVAFCCLLLLKHLYVATAPAVTAIIFFGCVLSAKSFTWQLGRFGAVAAVVSAVTLLVLGSVLLPGPGQSLVGNWQQLLARLLPWDRGLCHAYWAPNAWAIYNVADKALAAAIPKLAARLSTPWLSTLVRSGVSAAALTGGLVGAEGPTHAVLPSVLPLACTVMALLACLPGVVLASRRPTKRSLFLAGAIGAFGFFMFGWHVHEKAIMTAVILLAALAASDPVRFAPLFADTSLVAHCSLSPLLFGSLDTPLPLLAALAHDLICLVYLQQERLRPAQWGVRVLVWASVVVYLAWPWLGASSLPFVPLMALSLGCAAANVVCWVRLLALAWNDAYIH